MIELTLLASLLTEHNASHWEMSCAEWNQNRIEILSDKNLNSDAHEYLIDYLRTKVSDDCDAYIIWNFRFPYPNRTPHSFFYIIT